MSDGREPSTPLVFLGGTCNGSKWRDRIVPMLDRLGFESYDPVRDDWTEDMRADELMARTHARWRLTVLTPKMAGVYAIAEAVQDAASAKDKSILCVLDEDDGQTWTPGMRRSVEMVTGTVAAYGGAVVMSLPAAVHVMKVHEWGS